MVAPTTIVDRHVDLRPHLFPQRQQRFVDEHRAVVGVVDDVGELVGVEAEVERVEDAADERDAEVGLEVRAVVPAERGDAVAGADAEVEQGAGEAPGAAGEVARRCSDGSTCPRRRETISRRRKTCFGAAEDRRQRERDSPSSGRSCGGLYAESGRRMDSRERARRRREQLPARVVRSRRGRSDSRSN